MPSTSLGKNLHLCFSKIRRPLSDQSPPTPIPQDDHRRPLIKNYNSLYSHTAFSRRPFKSSDEPSLSESDTDAAAETPDFAAVFASQRFFFSSPGRSNSIAESLSTSSSPETRPESDALVRGSVAVPTYSPDPYMDFRRSMQEMVESRALVDVRANWEYLHELLLCYLALNPKSTHKFIVGAFADLLVSLMSAAG